MTERHLKVLVTADAVGGVWQYSLDLARGLSGLGIETVLALLGPPASEAQRKDAAAVPGLALVETGLPLDWLAADAGEIRRAGAAVADLARAHQADLVQLNSPALAAGTDFDVPVVAVQHSCVATWWDAVKGNTLPEDFAWRTALVAEGLRAANAVVTPTAAFGEATKRRYALRAAPNVVHNGRKPLRLARGARHNFAFTAGRLWDEGKNVATLDKAAGAIPVPLHAAGPLEGPNGARITLEHAYPLGAIDEAELGRWLSPRPVFVSAALYEPFGLAVLEAAAAGCPLILSDISTFRELWDGVALFVPPTDAAEFAEAIDAIVGNDFEREEMGRAARERASRFTPEAMAAQMAAVYRGLLPALRRPVLAARAA